MITRFLEHKMLSNTIKNSSFSTKTHDVDFELVLRQRANDRLSNTLQDEHLLPYYINSNDFFKMIKIYLLILSNLQLIKGQREVDQLIDGWFRESLTQSFFISRFQRNSDRCQDKHKVGIKRPEH